MKLSIVIPAYNEEQSIKSIIERCLEAKNYITNNSKIDDVDITVVSDGSFDNTVKYAQVYEADKKIKLIVFPENKGYGAAIKQGWDEADGDILGFLDADGTCDPNFFADLAELITEDGADIALGCRLNKNSKMPVTRRIGNTIFSIMLSFFSSQKVKDTASGMRLVKKEVLEDIYPLPDGLHFTPAMSARAVSNPELNILEKDMSYSEREGESKLSVIKDGIRFFNIITKLSFMYRPHVFLLSIGYIVGLLSILLMVEPIKYYIANNVIQDFMVYRFGIAGLGAILTTLLFSISYLSEKIIRVSILKNFNNSSNKSLVGRFFKSKVIFYITVISLFILGTAFVYDSFIDRITTGYTTEHWSRYLSMLFLYSISFILLATRVIDYTLKMIIERKIFLTSKNGK